MTANNTLLIESCKISVRDPLAMYLGGPTCVECFELSLADAARFSGHLCPTVVGAFLMSQAATKALFDDYVCERGVVEVHLATGPDAAATGPLSNVISYITGAWGITGFKGLNEKFRRKNLMHFHSTKVSPDKLRFENSVTNHAVEVSYDPLAISSDYRYAEIDTLDFPQSWQKRIELILLNAEKVVSVTSVA